MSKSEEKRIAVQLGLPLLSEGQQVYTGEDVRIPRLEVPQLAISYKDADEASDGEVKGEFVQINTDKTRKGLGKTITIQVLHHRQSLSSYAETEQMFTPEVSMKAKELSLFVVTTGATGKKSIRFVAKGEQKVLRERFPDLGYRRILYVLHDGELKALTVKGASFGKFIELQKALKGGSTSSVQLKLTTEKGKKGTVTYYAICFEPAEASNTEALNPVLKELSDWFAKYDVLIAEQQAQKAEEASIMRGDGPLTPTAAVLKTTVATPPTAEAVADELNLNDPELEEKKVDPSNLPF